MSQPKNEIQLLQASIDPHDDSYFRLLFQGKQIKYITIAAGVYEEDDMCFGPSLLSLLPPLPPGHWNDACIGKRPGSRRAYFKSAVQTQFPAVKSTWHPKIFNYLDMELVKKLRTNVYEAKVPSLAENAIAKFARFSWEVDHIDRECAAYQWIASHEIGPNFLGNIVEEERVIGFVLERVEGARYASADDYPECEKVLSRLHRMKIVHGDINRHNFLVVGNRAFLIDFDCARRTRDEKALEDEMLSLRQQLDSTSGRGGGSELVV